MQAQRWLPISIQGLRRPVAGGAGITSGKPTWVPLSQTDTLVIGVGNVPVEIKGMTQALELKMGVCGRPLRDDGAIHARGCRRDIRHGHN